MTGDGLHEAVALGPEWPASPGASGTVVLTVTGTADGDRVGALRVVDGRPAEVVDAGAVEADLALTLPAAEAAALLSGGLAPSVAYMQGRLKTAGDNRLLLAVLAATASPAWDRWRAASAGADAAARGG